MHRVTDFNLIIGHLPQWQKSDEITKTFSGLARYFEKISPYAFVLSALRLPTSTGMMVNCPRWLQVIMILVKIIIIQMISMVIICQFINICTHQCPSMDNREIVESCTRYRTEIILLVSRMISARLDTCFSSVMTWHGAPWPSML